MKKIRKIGICSLIMCMFLFTCGFEGCNEADYATTDVKNEADSFKIVRELTLVNTRLDKVQCKITGTFSLKFDNIDNQLEIIIKTGEEMFSRELFHINDDISYYMHTIDTEYAPRWKNYAYEVITYNDLYGTDNGDGPGKTAYQ